MPTYWYKLNSSVSINFLTFRLDIGYNSVKSIIPIGKVCFMRFSAKAEYGIRAILDIALYAGKETVKVKEIAKRQAIPKRFLEQVMTSLKKGELVGSVRGASGGYFLARPANQITLARVVQALEGPIELADCVSQDAACKCDRESLCVLRDLYDDIQNSMLNILDSVTLEDMCEKRKQKATSASYSYQI